MHRRPLAVTALAAILTAAALAPVAFPARTVAAGACGQHRSETAPPATIRVFRTATGAVDTVDFRTYVKNVLSREWISSWTTESLRSGAIAVKSYAWFQVLHWRGYVNEAGQCFDVFDSTRDQHYDPSRPTYAAMAAAVDATWSTLAHRSGRIFATYYNAGAAGEPCGARANGWQMFQWGTQACGRAGRSAAQILTTYYAGVTVLAAPSPVVPAASPVPTARPTAAPTPKPTAVHVPVPTSSAQSSLHPSASAVPTAHPTAASTPTPPSTPPMPAPSPAGVPGGGQAGLGAPPPPPPENPEPIVVTVAGAAPLVTETVPNPSERPTAEPHPDRSRLLGFEDEARAQRAAALGRRTDDAAARPVSPRWLAFRIAVGHLVSSLIAGEPPQSDPTALPYDGAPPTTARSARAPE